MDLILRPVRLSDAEDINEMRRQKGVRANTLALTTETIVFTEGSSVTWAVTTMYW